jgi:excinuclease UvrABC ATPase subunit
MKKKKCKDCKGTGYTVKTLSNDKQILIHCPKCMSSKSE